MTWLRVVQRWSVVSAAAVLLAGSVHAGEITVSAAVSLSDAFREIGKSFEASHPGTTVTFNFGASGQLLQQIVNAAPVDLFASADLDTMDKAERQKLLAPGSRFIFAHNTLVVAVPATTLNPPAHIDELLRPEWQRIAIGNPESVPAGRYAHDALRTSRFWRELQPRFVFAQNVRQVLDYLARGEVDAGFVYRTDAIAAPNRVRIAFSVATTEPVVYPVAVLKDSRNPGDAGKFVEFLRTAPARGILVRHGFGHP